MTWENSKRVRPVDTTFRCQDAEFAADSQVTTWRREDPPTRMAFKSMHLTLVRDPFFGALWYSGLTGHT